MLKIVVLEEMTDADLIEIIGKNAVVRIEDRGALERRRDGDLRDGEDTIDVIAAGKITSIQLSPTGSEPAGMFTYEEAKGTAEVARWPHDLKQATFTWETTQKVERKLGHFGDS